MRVRTYAFCAAAALCAIWPASAAATIDSIAVVPNSALSDFLCLGSTSTTPVKIVLTTAQGTTLQTITLPAADNVGDTGCPASANTFEPGADALAGGTQPAFGRYPAGARVTATQDGTSVTFALPYGAYSAGTTRLRNLPNPAALTGRRRLRERGGQLHGRRDDRRRGRHRDRHGAGHRLLGDPHHAR